MNHMQVLPPCYWQLSYMIVFDEISNRKDDLLTDSSIRNPFLHKSIDSTKILIYDRSGQKALI
jgi:hypothetical protein